jgi:DNA mismatch repair protein MutL
VVPSGQPAGSTATTVEVADLFYNVPARRRYLKQPATEFDHVVRVVAGYALATPDVAVALEHDGRERFATPGRGDLRGTVLATYGREVASAMIDVDHRPEGGPVERVHGLVSHPETNRASREYLSTFVNGRYVTASSVRRAVVDAYGDQLGDRYPFAAVFLEVDPAAVDANVHPRKLEVRFAEAERVRETVTGAVESALLGDGSLRSGAPRGASAPEETAVRPGDGPDGSDGTESERGTGSADARGAAADPDGDATGTIDPGGSGASSSSSVSDAGTGEGTSGGAEQPAAPDPDPDTDPDPPGQTPDDDLAAAGPDGSGEATGSRDRRPGHPDGSDRLDVAGTAEQARLGDEPPDPAYDRLPDLRVLGQLHDTYLVCETDDGLVLVDQHAADERINYERLRESLSGEVTAQALADPVRVELTAREAALFEAHGEALARLGFHAGLVDEPGSTAVEVGTVPAPLAGADGPALVRDVLSAFTSGEPAAAETVAAAVDDLLADLACYPSVTANTSLAEGSVVELLGALDDCENPYACPHGRPTVVELSTDEIERRFERDYPGHG